MKRNIPMAYEYAKKVEKNLVPYVSVEYTVEGCYFGEWEDVTSVSTLKEAISDLRSYRKNDNTASGFRLYYRYTKDGREGRRVYISIR